MDDGRTFTFGFSTGAESGITPLPFNEDNGLCTECEGRPAWVEVRPPGQPAAPARRLCPECLSRELRAKEPSEEEVWAREVERLAEAERTATPEELGRMAEFAEEWWATRRGPVPPAVAAFVARHRASAPPPAAPVLSGEVSAGDLQAARLALLVMRGALCEGRRRGGGPAGIVEADRVAVDPDPSPIPRETAAERIARMPKPLECVARATAEGVMAVRCRAITDPSQLEAHRAGEEYWAARGGHYVHLRDQYGDRYDELTIYCLGFEESLLVSVADAERVQRDYELRPMGTNASPPSFYLATNPAAAWAAAAAGAAYFMKCYFGPNDWAAQEAGRAIELRDPETWDAPRVYALAPDVGGDCTQCGLRPASWRATDTRETPWAERALCAECAAEELVPHALGAAAEFEAHVAALSPKGRRAVDDELRGTLERMARWWKVLPAPPKVVAALERCRAL